MVDKQSILLQKIKKMTSNKFFIALVLFVSFITGYLFGSFLDGIVLTVFVASLLLKKGSRLTAGYSILFLILIPIFQFLEGRSVRVFRLFSSEDLAVAVFYLLALSVVMEIIDSIVQKYTKPRVVKTHSEIKEAPVLKFLPSKYFDNATNTILQVPTILKPNNATQTIIQTLSEPKKVIMLPSPQPIQTRSLDGFVMGGTKTTIVLPK